VSCPDDADAISLCQQGDIAGLERLVARYQRPALHLAQLLSADRALAEDIVQDSFLLAYRGIGRFRAGQPFAPWLYRIVTNTARQRQRSARRRREVSLQRLLLGDVRETAAEHAAGYPAALVAPAASSDPATLVEQGDERMALLLALAELTPKQREAVALRYYLGFRAPEIATIVGCRPGTASERLRSGLRALEAIIRHRFPWLLITDSPASLPVVMGED
jgi:RNA polymerase sigma-70 factor, ECF subfamily